MYIPARGGDIGGAGGAWAPPLSKVGGLSPPTLTDKNGALLPVRGILVLTVSDIAYIHSIIAQY